jgi:hypothetical protein
MSSAELTTLSAFLDVVRGQVEQLVRGHRVRPPRAHGILQALGGLLRHQTESIGVSGQ